MNAILVNVIGTSGSGKSAVAEAIRQALEAKGIQVALKDDNGMGVVDEPPGLIAAELDARLGGIAKRGTLVSVSTHIVTRPAKEMV